MPQTRKVRISAEGEPVNFNTLSNQFKEITGLSLVINEEDKIEQEVSASMNKSQMEQNQALRYIDKAFSTLTHRPYKKSIKVTSSGVKYIELAFISKIVGEKYVDVINELEQETGYLMTVSDSCNQIEIINIAKRLMTEKDIKTKKNPSVFLDKMSVQVVIAQDIDDLMREEIGKRFLSLTGLSLEII